MKAWICTRYGGPEVLRLEERPRPVPKAGEVLIRVRAVPITSGDARIRGWNLPRGFGLVGRLALGVTRPRQPILGVEATGVVAAVGAGVTSFAPGDEVIGMAGRGYAEYATMSASGPITLKPGNLSFEEAATLCFGGTTALHFLRKAAVRPGDRVLVIGASGAVGTALVQLARHQGAQVTGVTSTANLDLVRELGPEAVIDYTRQDFAALGARYDVIADTVGATTFRACLPVLEEGGRFLAIAGDLSAMFARPSGTKRSIAGVAGERQEDVRELARLAEAGALKPVIDSIFPFADLPAAHARADTGRKRGSVVVSYPDG